MAGIETEQLKRWRLILGSDVERQLSRCSEDGFVLNREEQVMDEALAAIYDETAEELGSGSEGTGASRAGGLNKSSPRLAQWLADIRTFFSQDVVSVIQSDAINRKGLKELLFEPETLQNVKPDIGMVATLMSLKGRIPERTKDTARQLVAAVVEEIKKKLENNLRRAVTGALNKKEHSPIPSADSIDWKLTINRNLKNYNRELKKIVPERFYFFSKAKRTNNWTVILDMDQSGSMADSIIYASVAGSIFAGLPAIRTRVVAFDTEVVDLTEQCANDPVDMIFGIQLGGGTDINKSLKYCVQYISNPSKTLFILISDLYEGGNSKAMVQRMTEMVEAGVKVIALLALSDGGVPFYDEAMARKLSKVGIPCFGCTPLLLPELIEGALKGEDLKSLSKRISSTAKK